MSGRKLRRSPTPRAFNKHRAAYGTSSCDVLYEVHKHKGMLSVLSRILAKIIRIRTAIGAKLNRNSKHSSFSRKRRQGSNYLATVAQFDSSKLGFLRLVCVSQLQME